MLASPAGAVTRREGGQHADEVLTDAGLAQLSGYPADIAAEDLVTYFFLIRKTADGSWRGIGGPGLGRQHDPARVGGGARGRV